MAGTNSQGTRDYATNARLTIPVEHYEVHDGDMFCWSGSVTVNAGNTKRYRITAPNTTKRIHLNVFCTSNASGTWSFSEDPTLLAAGNARTPFNCNRNSANVATATVFEDTTTQAPNNDGTLLWTYITGTTGGGAAARSASSARGENEIILKQGEDYILKYVQGAANGEIAITFNFYET